MKIGILGLANSGKTTLFNAIAGLDLPTTAYITTEANPHEAVVKVPDERLSRLAEILEPPRIVYATVSYVDYIGITRGDLQQNKKVLEVFKEVDAFVYVIRAFEDESVVHPFGRIDPLEDLKTLRTELILTDLDLVEKRLQRMEEAKTKGRQIDRKQQQTLKKCLDCLESETPLKDCPLTEEDLTQLKHLAFFTTKPEIVVLNLHEQMLHTERASRLSAQLEQYLKGTTPVLPVSARIEMEISQLPEEERKEFLEDLGITEPAMHKLIRVCYEHLGLISFFTFNEKELRAWTLRKGATAWEAAGKVHSDIQRGFIRAEVIHTDDFLAAGSMAEARKRGLLRLEGKQYEVQDGDIITFRFNV